MLKKDNLILGIILGLITPVVGFFLYYLLVFVPNHVEWADFMNAVRTNKQMVPKIISICLVLNGVVFYLYTQRRKDITAKGIFLMTMLYAITILLLKLL